MRRDSSWLWPRADIVPLHTVDIVWQLPLCSALPWMQFRYACSFNASAIIKNTERSDLSVMCGIQQYTECSMKNAVYFAAHLSSSDKFVPLLLQTLIGSEQLELEWITISGPNHTLCTLHAALGARQAWSDWDRLRSLLFWAEDGRCDGNRVRSSYAPQRASQYQIIIWCVEGLDHAYRKSEIRQRRRISHSSET